MNQSMAYAVDSWSAARACTAPLRAEKFQGGNFSAFHQGIDMNNLMELLAAPPQRQVLALFKD